VKLTVAHDSPAELLVEVATEEDVKSLKELLTFRDRGVSFLIQRHKKNFRWKESDPEQWEAALAKLKEQQDRCILFERDGQWRTYSGLAEDIRLAMPTAVITDEVERPSHSGIAWAHVPEHEERYYQDEAKAALLKARHAAVQLPTGSGKSRIIAELCHELGLQAVIMAPSTSIARQLYNDFLRLFGKSKVGLYGDGKKEVGKLFTIGIAASLTRCEPGSDAYEFFSKAKVFLADESHMCPADTLEKVCTGLLASAVYRFFMSATQTRTDGAELLLKGITGPVVYTKTLEELVEAGFLAKPHWRMVKVPTTHFFASGDPMKMNQQHLLYSPFVLKKASLIINHLARQGKRILVLVDEMEQFSKLLNMLTVECRFAHGGVTKQNKGKIPEQYWESDPSALVKAFDNGDFPVLVGTSCISMGTDVRTCEVVVYLQGGTSAIQVPQAVGRGTRRGYQYADGHKKVDFQFIDFDPVITNDAYDDTGAEEDRPWSIVHRHAIARAKLYHNLYPNNLKWVS
jgi:superfamily II DNA or RNA helicase